MMTIENLIHCKPGTILIKGARRRIYLGWEMIGERRYIRYKVPSQPKRTIAELDSRFEKWLAGAETEWEHNSRELMQ